MRRRASQLRSGVTLGSLDDISAKTDGNGAKTWPRWIIRLGDPLKSSARRRNFLDRWHFWMRQRVLVLFGGVLNATLTRRPRCKKARTRRNETRETSEKSWDQP